jgi:hypothetical protein
VSDVFTFTSQHMAWKHRHVRMLAFQCLHTCQLVQIDGTFSLFGSLCRRKIEQTSLMNLLFSLLIRHFCSPVAKPMWLQAPFFNSRAACRGEIRVTMPRATRSSAISRPVHWLIGRPAFVGVSQASAAI